jgi:hypothetical protein
MDNEELIFQLLLETNIVDAGGQAAATLKEVQSSAQSAATSVQAVGTAAESSASKVTDSAQKETAAIQQVNRALEQQAEQEARIDAMLANMQARRAQRTPLDPSTFATTGATAQPQWDPLVRPFPAGEKIDWGGLKPSDIGEVEQATQRSALGIRGMRLEMMAFTASAELGLNSVEAALGRDTQASEAMRIGVEGLRVGMSTLMLGMMTAENGALNVGLMAATGGVMALAAALPIAIEWLNKQHEAEVQLVEATDPYIQSLAREAEGNTKLAASIRDLAEAKVNAKNAQVNAPNVPGIGGSDSALFMPALMSQMSDVAQAHLKAEQAQVWELASSYAELNRIRSSPVRAIQPEDLATLTVYNAELQRSAGLNAFYATQVRLAGAAQQQFITDVANSAQGLEPLDQIIQRTATRWSDYDTLLRDRLPISMKVASDANDKFITDVRTGISQAAQEAKQFAESYRQMIQSIAQSVITPTKVEGTDATRLELETQLGKVRQKLEEDSGPRQHHILEQQAADLQAALGQLGPYVDKWDEYGRRLEAIKQAAAQGVVNPDWQNMIPADVLAKGTAAIQAWAAAEEQAFYNGQRLDKLDYGH